MRFPFLLCGVSVVQPDHQTVPDRGHKSVVARNYQGIRKKRFLAELARTSHVSQSAERAGVSLSTVYFWRSNDAGFRKRWLRALAAGYELLEMEMLQRARGGTEKTIYYRGAPVGNVREFDDGLAFRLLALHKQTIAQSRNAETEQQADESNIGARLDQKLADMRERWLRHKAATADEAAAGDREDGR